MSALQAGLVWDLAKLPAQWGWSQPAPGLHGKRGSPAVQSCHILACLKLEQISPWLPPTLEMSQGVIVSVWPFASLPCQAFWLLPPGCFLPQWCLSGTFICTETFTPFFPHSLHFWGLSSLLKPARGVFGVNIFPSSRLNCYFLSNSHLSMGRVLKRAVYSC